MFNFLLAVFFILVIYKFVTFVTKPRSSAPGPRGWPIIGNMLEFDPQHPITTIGDWAKKYGDIFKIRILSDEVVIVSGDVIYEVLVTRGEDFEGRPLRPRDLWVTDNHQDIAFSDYSPQWAVRRRVLTKAIKNYGTGMKRIELVTLDEIQSCLEAWESRKGAVFDPFDDTYHHIINIMAILVLGRRLEREETDIIKDADYCMETTMGTGEGFELDVFPFLKYFGNKTYKKIQNLVKQRDAFNGKWISFMKNDLNEKNIRGILDYLLVAQKDPKTPLNDSEVNLMMMNTMHAGVTTTQSALYSTLLILMHRPDLQTKLQETIDNTIGRHSLPTLEDKDKMPYISAFILEILRYISQLAFALPHKATKDVILRGVVIPKETQVWVNLFGLHHDDRYFPDPWTIKPERFLDNDGKLLPPDERKLLLPFGAGRRGCMGENMAKARLFLFIVALLQKFTFQPEDGAKPPSCDPLGFVMGLVMRPKAYKLRAVERV